eukprot:SAG25_NODE_10774_length_323_cov_0.687500_1_plen_52_part_10
MGLAVAATDLLRAWLLGRTNLILRSARVFGCTRYVCVCTENPENSGLTLRIT